MLFAGDLARITPDEIATPLLLAVAKDIRAGASEDRKSDWLKMMLSVPCTFRRLDEDDAKFAELARTFFKSSQKMNIW